MAQYPLSGTGRTMALLALAAAGAAPATQPDAATPTLPSTRPAALLDGVDAAYAALTSARLDGTITAHFDVAGQVQDHTASFASTFAAPNKFRHEVVGDTLAVSTGAHVYATLAATDEYVTGDAPKGRSADWPAGVGGLLAKQNPSLLLAAVPSAKAELARGTSAVADGPAVTIDGVACPTVHLDLTDPAGETVTMAFDPATHLLRRATYDLAEMLRHRGTTDVRAATVTIDYPAAAAGVTLAADQFAYVPPAGAVLASAGPVGQGDVAGDDDDADGPAAKLVGHPAPAFKLDGLDGKPVSLADLKGKVVVVDLWATWCGPCVQSLPHLDAMWKDYQKAGAAMTAFAVDEQQDADTVKPFVAKKGWALPVLLDTDGSVGKAYGANAIPETVVIGKDGVVKKVTVGSGQEDVIHAAVEKALKE